MASRKLLTESKNTIMIDSVDLLFLCSSLQTTDPTHASECREEARTRMADRGDVGISDTRTQHTDCVHRLLQSTHSTEFSQNLCLKKGSF